MTIKEDKKRSCFILCDENGIERMDIPYDMIDDFIEEVRHAREVYVRRLSRNSGKRSDKRRKEIMGALKSLGRATSRDIFIQMGKPSYYSSRTISECLRTMVGKG